MTRITINVHDVRGPHVRKVTFLVVDRGAAGVEVLQERGGSQVRSPCFSVGSYIVDIAAERVP